jgi:hypothetical protein
MLQTGLLAADKKNALKQPSIHVQCKKLTFSIASVA